jgi:hypothetical protein
MFHSDKIQRICSNIAAGYLSMSEEAERLDAFLYAQLFTFGIQRACFKADKYAVTSWWFQ